jgi:hypothetical protein
MWLFVLSVVLLAAKLLDNSAWCKLFFPYDNLVEAHSHIVTLKFKMIGLLPLIVTICSLVVLSALRKLQSFWLGLSYVLVASVCNASFRRL